MADLSASRAFLDAITDDFDYELTKRWWARLLADEAAMNRWLSKLWRTEEAGYDDNNNAILQHGMEDESRPYNIFRRTGEDERIHAGLLIDVLSDRGIVPVKEDQPASLYWAHLYPFITDMKTCAAIFAVGEQLAAIRFSVLYGLPGTPPDVMRFLDRALPDETYHAKAFASLADSEQMKLAYDQHKVAVELLKR